MAERGRGPQVIAVVGGESTGKSTLAEALAERLPGLPVWEYLRVWVDRMGRVPERHEQVEVLRGQVAAEDAALELAAERGLPWVISDSGALMTAAYSVLYYDDESLVPVAVSATRRCRLTVWCGDDVPWTADPQRDGPAARAAGQRVLGDLLAASGLPWLQVTGDVGSRVAQVVAALAAAPPA